MGENNEFFENFERNKYLKKLPSMQRVKYSTVQVYVFSCPMLSLVLQTPNADIEYYIDPLNTNEIRLFGVQSDGVVYAREYLQSRNSYSVG